MRIAFTVGALAALLFTPTSHAETNKACTIKATEALPHITGARD
jgi:gas vesicle protein